ncbi:MAG: HigA family addiction module antitoxin [Alphaproteobacteria bacterium]
MRNATTSPVDHPGSFIVEELEARGWSQADLAYILGKSAAQVNPILTGKVSISPDMATALGEAFDMPADFFANLQKMYDLQKAKRPDPGVRTRASWQAYFPVREMINRGWIEATEPGLLDLQMLRFFEKNRVEDIPFISDAPVVMGHAARKSSAYDAVTPIQYAWLHRVRKIALGMECPPYSKELLSNNLDQIRAHMLDIKDDLIRIPAILGKAGVRLVFVESLAGSKIDGVCLWLGDQPVIGMTLRLDRPDNFCFVLRHEIEHVLRGDGQEEKFAPVDTFDGDYSDAASDDLPDCEKIANAKAADFCVPKDLLDSFLARKGEFISERDVLNFAGRLAIHPAIVIGQIQHKRQRYNWLRKYQTSVRPFLLDWKFTDGWGSTPPTGL